VADTWNHRLQVFDTEGTFLAKWGSYGQTAAKADLFYGPRDVAVDASGRVLVTDTGNKRIVVYDREGRLLTQWGGPGSELGQFEEPVGLAVAPANVFNSGGALFVADTWNQRVQVFDGEGVFMRQWLVEAWYGDSVANKPYLTVDGAGRVYITDPEGALVAVFGYEGDLLASFGHYGHDAGAFSLPTGIDVAASGQIYVADTNNHRIVVFEQLP